MPGSVRSLGMNGYSSSDSRRPTRKLSDLMDKAMQSPLVLLWVKKQTWNDPVAQRKMTTLDNMEKQDTWQEGWQGQ